MTTICCCCTSGDSTYIDMYGEEGSQLNIIQIILKHLSFLTIAPNDLISPFICNKCWLTIQNFDALYDKVWKLQDIKTNAYVAVEPCTANNNPENEPLKDSINYHLINGTEGIFFNDTLIICNQMKPSPTVFAKDLVDTSFDKKQDTERPLIEADFVEEDKKIPGHFIDSNEFIADKPILDYVNLDCSECSVEFKTFYEFKSHFKIVHHQKGRVKCCGRSFTRRFEVMEHISLHQNPDKFKCKTCNKTFAAECNLKRHIESHFSHELRPFKCKLCHCGFTSSHRLNTHIRIRHSANEEKDFLCDICSKAFFIKEQISNHMKNMHGGHIPAICEICAKVFSNETKLKAHSQTTHFHKRQQCSVCDIWLKHKKGLKAHMKRHQATEPSICTICSRSFPRKSSLNAHMRYVHATAKHKCTMCGKALKTSTDLKEHIARHTGEVLYKCQFCTKTFNNNANKSKHRNRIHSQEYAMYLISQQKNCI